ILRALVNAAFIPLVEAGMPKQEAGNWLARELMRNGIKQLSGEKISGRQIIRWRMELGAKSLKGSDEAFSMVVHGALRTMLEKIGQLQPPSETPLQRSEAQVTARAFIKLLRLAGF